MPTALRLRLPIACAALLMLSCSSLTASDAIVDRAIAHHGGDHYRSTSTELDVCSKSGCFEIEATVDGERFAYDVRQPATDDRPERRVLSTNDRVELWVGGEPSALEPGEEQRWRDWASARVYFCFLPFRLRDPSVHAVEIGDETWDGRTLRKVKVTFDAGSSTDASDEYLYWFDPETARLEQFAYSYEGDPGGLRFRRAFNYRRAGGILFFDQENWGLEGGGLTVDSITPDLVADSFRRVSTVEIVDPRVEPLP